MKNLRILYILFLVLGLGTTQLGVAQVKSKTTTKTQTKAKPKATTTKPKPMTDFRSQQPKAGPAPLIQISDYTVHSLKNGLKVIVVENHKLPRASFQLFIDNDPILEKDSKGYVDLAGQMLGKGTSKKSKAQLDEAIDFLGASFSANANGFFASSLTKHSEKLLELASEAVLDPSFPEAEFQKIKSQSQSGLQQAKDDANTISANVASVLNFGKDFPYGENMTEKTLEKITLQQCKEYYNTYFKPNNAYFIAVGDIKAEKAIALAEKFFGGWTPGIVPKNNYSAPKQNNQPMVSFVNKDGAVQSVINVTYPVVLKPGTEDVVRVAVMNNILGGHGFTARLFQNLREKHAFTYGAYSTIGPDKLAGTFSASASVRNEVTDSAVTQFLNEMNRIRTEKVTDLELSSIKASLAGDFSRSLERPQTVANFALSTIRFNLPKDYYKTYLARLDAVNADAVLQTAQKYILPNNANILVVGNKDEVADKLKQFAPDKKVNFYNAYGDKVVDSAPVDLGNLTAGNVIADYVKAVGGVDQINKVKDVHFIAQTNVQGMAIQTDKYVKMPDKYAEKMSMNGSVVQEQIVNGKKGIQGQMGQNSAMDEESLNAIIDEIGLIPQVKYEAEKYTLKLIGTENVEGNDAYKIEVVSPKGAKKLEYYDVKSKLKLREVMSQTAGEKIVTMVTDFSDYKAVDGIMIPHKAVITGGMMPVPIEMITNSVEINKGINDSMFKVD